MGEPLRVLGHALLTRGGHPFEVAQEADAAHMRDSAASNGFALVPLVDGTAAEAERAWLVALLRRSHEELSEWAETYDGGDYQLLADIEQELAKHE